VTARLNISRRLAALGGKTGHPMSVAEVAKAGHPNIGPRGCQEPVDLSSPRLVDSAVPRKGGGCLRKSRRTFPEKPHADSGTFLSRASVSQIGLMDVCPAVVASCCGTLGQLPLERLTRPRLFKTPITRSQIRRIPNFPSRKKRYSDTVDRQILLNKIMVRPLGSGLTDIK